MKKRTRKKIAIRKSVPAEPALPCAVNLCVRLGYWQAPIVCHSDSWLSTWRDTLPIDLRELCDVETAGITVDFQDNDSISGCCVCRLPQHDPGLAWEPETPSSSASSMLSQHDLLFFSLIRQLLGDNQAYSWISLANIRGMWGLTLVLFFNGNESASGEERWMLRSTVSRDLIAKFNSRVKFRFKLTFRYPYCTCTLPPYQIPRGHRALPKAKMPWIMMLGSNLV